MREQQHKVADVLIEMEREMRRVGLWRSTSPPLSALSSSVPFCFDTLPFSQWLQWVLIPKVKILLEEDAPLPGFSDIHPLAEEVLTPMDVETGHLLSLIREFDRLLSG